MYQLVAKSFFLLIFSLSMNVLAKETATSANEIAKIYAEYEKQEEAFFKTEITQKNLKEKIENLSEKLNTAYKKIKQIETKENKTILSEEGNQLSLNIEILQPLKDLSLSQLSKESCDKAIHESQLNRTEEIDKESDEIDKVIKKVCKIN